MADALVTIADTYYDPVTQLPVPKPIVRVEYIDRPVFKRAGGLVSGGPRHVPGNVDGTFAVDLYQKSSVDSSSARVQLTFPYGEAIAGAPPDTPGPLTLEDLKQSFGWQVVATTEQVTLVEGTPGVDWHIPVAWDSATTYFPPAGVTYQGSSWRALVENTNSPPSPLNTDWVYVAIGAGSFGFTDASNFGADLATAVSAYSAALAGGLGTLQVSVPTLCGANATVPPNMTLVLPNAGSISVASGVTLKILGYVDDPGPRQIFAASATNDGTAGSGTVSFAYPSWAGTVHYGVGDRVTYGGPNVSGGFLWEATQPSLFPFTITAPTGVGAITGTVAITYTGEGTILAGQTVTVDTGGTLESVVVASSPAPTYNANTQTGTFTGTFTKVHTAPVAAVAPSASPRTNQITAAITSGMLNAPQTVTYTGQSIGQNAYLLVEPGTASEELVQIAGAPIYFAPTASGTLTATFTKAHTAPFEVTNPRWKRTTGIPEKGFTGTVRPEWWGAKADSDTGMVNTDCAPAFNAMIAALPGRGGVTIECSGGIYAFRSTIHIDSFISPNQKQDFTIEGNYSPLAQSGPTATTFMWAGPSTWPSMADILAGTPITLTPLFEGHSREVYTRGVYFTVANGYTCDVLVDIDWATTTTSTSAVSHSMRFENCAWGFPNGYLAGISGQPRLLVRIGGNNLPNGEYHTFLSSEFMNAVPNGAVKGWWQQQWTYAQGEIVWWAGECYQSLIDNNVGNKPDVGLTLTLNPVRSATWMVVDPSIVGGCALYTPNTSAQVKRTITENCHFAGTRTNSANYPTQQWGIYQATGSFECLWGEFYSMPQAIRVASAWDYIKIDGITSEGCQQLYRADGQAGSQPTLISNGRLALAQVDTTTPVGGEYIHCNTGPTTLQSLQFNPGETTSLNPAFSIYAPSASSIAMHDLRTPTFAFLVTDSMDAPFVIEGCRVKQGTGNSDRTLPRIMGHGAVANAGSATGSGVGSGVYHSPMAIGPFPTNVTPKILRPIAPNIHPMNAQGFKGANHAGAIPSVTTVTFSGGGGTGAAATATVAAGVVTAIAVTSGGSGYATPPTVTIGGAGSGATATATLTSNAVSAVAVTGGGTGYGPAAYKYQWTRWNGGTEYPVGVIISVNATFTDTNLNQWTGEIFLAPPPVSKPTDSKYTIYRSDDGITYYKLSDVTIGSQSFIDIAPAVGPSTPYTTALPSFPNAIEAGIYDWVLTAANAAGLETDTSDRFTQQFTTPVQPTVSAYYPTAGTDHLCVYRSKVFPGGNPVGAALATGAGMEDGSRIYAAAAVYDPIVITNLTGGGTAITVGSRQVDYTGSLVPAVGQKLLIDFMTANQETVTVTAQSGSTFTAVFNKTHTAGASLFGASALSHISTPSASLKASAAVNQSQALITSMPSTPAGTWRLLVRSKSGGLSFTANFFPVALVQNNSAAVSITDAATDASLTAAQIFAPTLLKLPITLRPQDYGNYIVGNVDDTTKDASLPVTAAQPNPAGTNLAVIESLHVTDGGARIGGDLTIAGGQFAGQGTLRMSGPASGLGTPAVAGAGTAAFYYDNVGNRLRVSVNGSAWADMLAVTQQDVVYSGLLASTGTGNVVLVPNGGGGATATATVSGGAVTGVTVTNAGDGYAVAPTILFAPQGGDTPSVTATATATTTNWGVTGIAVNTGGAGYTNPPLVVIVPSGANAAGAGATYTLASDANKQRGRFTITPSNGVLSVTVGSGGTGYVQGTPATFTGGAGTGATGYVNVTAGAITSITVTNSGTGYTSAPTVTAPTGTGATLTAVLSATNSSTTARIVLAGHTKVPGYANADFYGTPSGGTANVTLKLSNAQLSPNSDKILLDVVPSAAPTVGNTYNMAYFVLP